RICANGAPCAASPTRRSANSTFPALRQSFPAGRPRPRSPPTVWASITRTCCATSSAFPKRRSKNSIGTRRSSCPLRRAVTAWAAATPNLARLLTSLFARTNIEEIHCRGLGEHRLGNAVARGAAAILGALRRLQIGAKVPRPFDDLAADRQPLRLE